MFLKLYKHCSTYFRVVSHFVELCMLGHIKKRLLVAQLMRPGKLAGSLHVLSMKSCLTVEKQSLAELEFCKILTFGITLVNSFVDQAVPFVFEVNWLQKWLLQSCEVDGSFFWESHLRITPDTNHSATDVFGSDAFVDAMMSEDFEEWDMWIFTACLQVFSLLVQINALFCRVNECGRFVYLTKCKAD